MNAPLRMLAPAPVEIEDLAQDFAECCDIQAGLVNQGLVSKQTAVDNLQALIEAWKVPEEDRDVAQAIMAQAFAPLEQQPCEHCGLKINQHRRVDTDNGPEFFCADIAPDEPLQADYASTIVRRWEMADDRDRWQHTGEPPPIPVVIDPHPTKATYRTPQSTIDAFWYVPPERLAGWLADRPKDAPYLHELWVKKCQTKQ